MARRKRRKTKKSRPQSPAAQPQLTLGDVVRVKNEVMDPDYDGYGIGGWSGEILRAERMDEVERDVDAFEHPANRGRVGDVGRHGKHARLAWCAAAPRGRNDLPVLDELRDERSPNDSGRAQNREPHG